MFGVELVQAQRAWHDIMPSTGIKSCIAYFILQIAD